MKLTLRLSAIVVAIAALIDPAIVRRVRAPLAVAVHLPPASDPDFTRAGSMRTEIASALDDRIVVDGGAAPDAIVAIGNAALPQGSSTPVFSVPIVPRHLSTAILDVTVPDWTVPGQASYVGAVIRGRGLAGRTTSLSLVLLGAAVQVIDHRWNQDDERFEARFSFAPPTAGVHRVRVVARTDGVDEESVADALLVTRSRPLRILAFEPRPSWPVAFVRRSLEADAIFNVAFTSRSARLAATTTGVAPLSLGTLDVEHFDAILVGALDELTDSDMRVLDRFAAKRGGTLILLPDRRLPESIRVRFSLPRTAETLVETPVRVQTSTASMRASELLLMNGADDTLAVLASVRHGGVDRPVIASVNHGNGRVVLSGAIDAWRYRADEPGSFGALWRGIAADAAIAAPPRIHVSLAPAIGRSLEPVTVSVSLRDSELDAGQSGFTMPPIAAWLSGTRDREMIRLWPGPRAGLYEARLIAPAPGRYTVTVAAGDTSSEIPLLITDDAVHPARDESAAAAYAAQESGGAVVSSAKDLPLAVARIDTDLVQTLTRPMRSAWWIVPFSLLLCAEWALRRRSGLS